MVDVIAGIIGVSGVLLFIYFAYILWRDEKTFWDRYGVTIILIFVAIHTIYFT